MIPFNFASTNYLSVLVMVVGFLTFFLTKITIAWVNKNKLLDDPNSAKDRKYQTQPVPLLGGSAACLVAIFGMAVVWLTIKYNLFELEGMFRQNLEPFHLFYVLLAVLLMLVGGYMDDKYQMSPKLQILFILGAISLVVFGSGVLVEYTSWTGQLPYLVSVLITFTWLGFCTASTKFLDGHDGLVVSVGIISFLTIASISLLPNIWQPTVFIFSMIWVVCLSIFSYWNFPNAKAYLGEGASEIIGFMIGVLSILSGAKIATAFCILGWFILDIFLVWSIRVSQGRNPLTSADRNHWHHRLLDLGFNKIQVLVFTWIILISSSLVAVQDKTSWKIAFLGFEFLFLMVIFFLSNRFKKNKKSTLI